MRPEIEIRDNDVNKVFKALASKTRWKILKLLKNGEDLDISRIAEKLKQTEANISAQIKILESAGLVISHYEPGEHGVRKVCEPACERLIIKIIDNSGLDSKKTEKKIEKKIDFQNKGSIVKNLGDFYTKITTNPFIGEWKKLDYYQKVCEKKIWSPEFCPKCGLECKLSGKISSTEE